MDSVANIILYFIVAICMVTFSVLTVTSRKILRSATYLLFVLLSTAVFYFQLGYQFLGAVQIAVYAGGIMVLFVFSILLTRHPDEKTALLSHHKRALGIILSVVSLVVLLLALFNMPWVAGESLQSMLETGKEIDMKVIGDALVGTNKFQYLLPFEAVSVLLLACIIGGVTVARKR